MRRRTHSILGTVALMFCVGTFSFIYIQQQIQAKEVDAIAKNSVIQTRPAVQKESVASAKKDVKVTVR